MFFTDADMIFHPEFFSEMSTNYFAQWRGTGNLITAARINVSRQVAHGLVHSVKYEDKQIDNAFKICWDNKEGYSNRAYAPGAGYFQMVETKYLIDNKIRYADQLRDCSVFDRGTWTTPADRVFRSKMAKVLCLKKDPDKSGSRDILKPILHLNHWRRHEDGWVDECR